MSENLNLVRSLFADWERGDFGQAIGEAVDDRCRRRERGPGVWRLREGKIACFKIYQSSHDALKAVGLTE